MKNITINTQSSIKIGNIYFDPFKIEDEIHDADIIFITHPHYDHFDIDSINKIVNDKTLIIIPDDLELCKALKDYNFNITHPYTKYNINDITVEPIPSYNINKPYHPKDNNWLGYVITIDNERYYIMGDTDITLEAKKVTCDYLFIPIGGTYTMNYQEASELTNIIKPKMVYPIHFGSIVGNKEDFNKFKDLVNDDIEVINKLF